MNLRVRISIFSCLIVLLVPLIVGSMASKSDAAHSRRSSTGSSHNSFNDSLGSPRTSRSFSGSKLRSLRTAPIIRLLAKHPRATAVGITTLTLGSIIAGVSTWALVDPLTTIDGIGGFPTGIALNADGSLAYVISRGISMVDLDNHKILMSNPVNDGTLTAVAVNPQNGLIYVAGAKNITVMNQDMSIKTQIPREVNDYWIRSMEFSPDGQKLYAAYVGLDGSGKIGVIDFTTDPRNPPITTTMDTQGIRKLILSPDGKTAYVALQDFEVLKFDTQTKTVTDRIQNAGNSPNIDLSPDGKTLYIQSIFIDAINTETNQRTRVSDEPIYNGEDIAVSQDGQLMTVISWTSRTSDSPAKAGAYLVSLQNGEILRKVRREPSRPDRVVAHPTKNVFYFDETNPGLFHNQSGSKIAIFDEKLWLGK